MTTARERLKRRNQLQKLGWRPRDIELMLFMPTRRELDEFEELLCVSAEMRGRARELRAHFPEAKIVSIKKGAGK
jgi:hypothetical protein